MKIFIATYGSRGDVQPYVALGKGLQDAGHHVTLATSERFRAFVEEHDLQYGYMNDDLLEILDTDQGRDRKHEQSVSSGQADIFHDEARWSYAAIAAQGLLGSDKGFQS